MLTDLQTLYVKHILENRGLNYQPLTDELLDHICTEIEFDMANGLSFDEACNKCYSESFSEKEINNTQKKTVQLLNRKYTIMKNITTLSGTIAASFLIFTLFINATDQPSIRPFNDSNNIRLTSSFGMRMHPIEKVRKHHRGVDFAMPIGTPILAAGDGTVIKAEEKTEGYGTIVKIKHDDSFVTTYAQLSKLMVKVGDKVTKGDKIALSGNSGRSTAPHLHYEVIKDKKAVDPQLYMGEDLK